VSIEVEAVGRTSLEELADLENRILLLEEMKLVDKRMKWRLYPCWPVLGAVGDELGDGPCCADDW